MAEITLVIIDDHPLFRQGVADPLTLENDFKLVGQAASGEEGLYLIRRLQPAVAVVDVNLPELNGQQLTRQIVSEKIHTRILLLTAYDDTEQKIHAIRVGAAAYCTKDVRPEVLVNIIRQVNAGKYVIDEKTYDSNEIMAWQAINSDSSLRFYCDS